MNKQLIQIVIDSLSPSFAELSGLDGEDEKYWSEYSDELEYSLSLADEKDSLIKNINWTLKNSFSILADHHAATDIALTLESLAPEEYAGRFQY